MYSVTPRNAHVCGFSASAKTTDSTDFRNVFPERKLNIKSADLGSRKTREANVPNYALLCPFTAHVQTQTRIYKP